MNSEPLSSFADIEREVGVIRHFYETLVFGGMDTCDADFFNNKDLLRRIYTSYPGIIDTKEKLYHLKTVLSVLPNTSESNRLESIALNMLLDVDEIKLRLPNRFSISKSKLLHVGNVNQINILYTQNESTEQDTTPKNVNACTLGFYLLHDTPKNKFIITNVQGAIKASRHRENGVKKVHTIYGKLSSFYEMNWRSGLVKELVTYAEGNNLVIGGEMPPIYSMIGSSIMQYPYYSLSTFLSFLKGGIPLQNISFRITPDEFADTWACLVSKIASGQIEPYRYLENRINEYAAFYKQIHTPTESNSHDSFEIKDRKCVAKFLQLLE